MTDLTDMPLVPSPVELAPAVSVSSRYAVQTSTGLWSGYSLRAFAEDFLNNGIWKPAEDMDDDGHWTPRIGDDGEQVMEQVTPAPPEGSFVVEQRVYETGWFVSELPA